MFAYEKAHHTDELFKIKRHGHDLLMINLSVEDSGNRKKRV